MAILPVGGLDILKGFLSAGVTTSALQISARYLSARNVTFLHAIHEMRKIEPELSYSEFGDRYTAPYKEQRQKSYFESAPEHSYVPDNLLQEKPLSQPTRYSYKIELSFTDPKTGDVTSRHRTIFSDRKLDNIEAAELADEVFSDSPTSAPLEGEELYLVEVFHNEGWDY